MKRDALAAVAVALLALVALGVAAATLDSAVDVGSGGFGGGGGEASSVGEDAGDPGVLSSSGEEGQFSVSGLCFPFLREPPAVIALLVGLTLLAGVTYRDTASPFTSVAVAGVLGVPIGALFWVLSTCRSVAQNLSLSLGTGGNGSGLFPAGAAGGGLGGGEGAASAPQALFALVLVVAVIASAAALLLAGGDDEADGGAGRGDDPAEEEEEPPDLAAIGRTAGEAADRIESSDADNEVYRAWRDMTDVLDVDRPASSTPAEFATAAVEAGVDEEPVTALTEVFERVRYGGEDATEERERRAVEALRRIEERHGGDA